MGMIAQAATRNKQTALREVGGWKSFILCIWDQITLKIHLPKIFLAASHVVGKCLERLEWIW